MAIQVSINFPTAQPFKKAFENDELFYFFVRDDDLIVKIRDEVFYNERLPDTVVRDQCRIQGVRRRSGMTEIKILLVKEKHGLWLPRW